MPRIRWFWPGSRLAFQITTVIFLVVAATGLVAYVRVSATVGQRSEVRFAERVKRGAAQVYDQLLQSERLVLADVSLLAEGAAFVDRVSAGDALEALRLTIPDRSFGEGAPGVDLGMTVYDASGKLLLRTHQPLDRQEGELPVTVRRALAGESTVTIRDDEYFGLSFAGAAPIETPDGRIAGALETLTRIDQPFVERLAMLSAADIAIVTDRRIIRSGRQNQIPTMRELPANPTALTVPTQLTIAGESYLSMTVPLRAGISGDAGTIYIGVNRSVIDADRQDAQRQVLTASAIALGVGAALAISFGVLLTRPVAALAAAARRIQENDLHSPVPRSGSREMRELAAALDEMRLAIRETREDLVGHNVELAQRVETSDAGLSAATVELSVMHSIIQALSTMPIGGPAAASSAVIEQLLRLDWIDGACVVLSDADGGFRVTAERGFDPDVAAATMHAVEESFDASVRSAGVFVEDIRDAEPLRARLASRRLRAVALLPLPGPGGAGASSGALLVAAAQPTPYLDSRRSLLRASANDLAVSIHRVRLTEAVEESRRRAESVLSEMTDGLIVLNGRGQCQVCNQAAARMLGIDAAHAVGRPALDWLPLPASIVDRVLHPATPPAGVTGVAGITATTSAAAMSETTTPGEAPVVTEHAGRLLALSTSPLHDADPARRGLILHIRDVTDIFAAERLKQDFVLMVGHELRTPLTLIPASVDLLTEEGAGTLTATQLRITEMLRNNSERLLHLINDLLDMSALDSGSVRTQPDHASLSRVVDGVVESHSAGAHARGITLAALQPASPVFAWMDAHRIQQVINNLVENAVKYGASDGHVTIRVTPGEPFVRVDVEDDGPGIPPDEQPMLFTKFYRATAVRARSGGTGLGLAIAASIVELHGGKIWCESDGKSGCTFSFTVPAEPPPGDAQLDP